MSFFKSLLSSKTIVENASKGIDAAFLTNEEKTQYFLKYIESSMPMNVSRRFMAIVVTLMWALTGGIEIGLILTGSDRIEEFHNFATIYVMPSFSVLMGFYFWKRISGN